MGTKYAVDESFFDVWSDQMAYVLGLWFADGSLEYAPAMRGHYIRVTSIDAETILSVQKALCSQHTINTIERGGNYKKAYMLRIGSVRLFQGLKNHGVHERKSLSVQFPKIPPRYLASFIRGYFDGDGCVHIEKDKSGNTRRLTTVFTSGSRAFLAKLQEILHTHAGLSKDRKLHTTNGIGTAYQLRYSTRDAMRLFIFLYPENMQDYLFLQRKYDIFNRYFVQRNLLRSDLSAVLNTKGPVVKR